MRVYLICVPAHSLLSTTERQSQITWYVCQCENQCKEKSMHQLQSREIASLCAMICIICGSIETLAAVCRFSVKWHIFCISTTTRRTWELAVETRLARFFWRFSSLSQSPPPPLQVEFLVISHSYITKAFSYHCGGGKRRFSAVPFFPITVALKAPPTIVSQRCGRILVA